MLVAGLTPIGKLEEMVNIGTLTAFILVSIGVIVLRKTRPDLPRAFKVPFVAGAADPVRGHLRLAHPEPVDRDLVPLRDLDGARLRHLLPYGSQEVPPGHRGDAARDVRTSTTWRRIARATRVARHLGSSTSRPPLAGGGLGGRLSHARDRPPDPPRSAVAVADGDLQPRRRGRVGQRPSTRSPVRRRSRSSPPVCTPRPATCGSGPDQTGIQLAVHPLAARALFGRPAAELSVTDYDGRRGPRPLRCPHPAAPHREPDWSVPSPLLGDHLRRWLDRPPPRRGAQRGAARLAACWRPPVAGCRSP